MKCTSLPYVFKFALSHNWQFNLCLSQSHLSACPDQEKPSNKSNILKMFVLLSKVHTLKNVIKCLRLSGLKKQNSNTYPVIGAGAKLTVLVTEALSGYSACPVWSADVLFGVAAGLAHKDIGHVGAADLGAGEVHPGATLIALDHGASGKGLHAEACDQVPWVFIWGRGKKQRQKENYNHMLFNHWPTDTQKCNLLFCFLFECTCIICTKV